MTLLIYEDFRSRSSLPVCCLSAPARAACTADRACEKNNGSTEHAEVCRHIVDILRIIF